MERSSIALGGFLGVFLVATSLGVDDPVTPQAVSTTVDITKQHKKPYVKALEVDSNARDPSDVRPLKPKDKGKLLEGNMFQSWNIGVSFADDALGSNGWGPGHPEWSDESDDIIGIFLHKVRVRESITFACDSAGFAICPPAPMVWEFVEWKLLTFSEYGGRDELEVDGQPGKYKIPEIIMPPGPNLLDDDNSKLVLRDTFRPRIRGVGCWSLWMSEAYLILPSHPRFFDIMDRLEEYNAKDNDGYIQIPGETRFEISGEYRNTASQRVVRGWDNGGVIDGRDSVGAEAGDGVEDIPQSTGAETLDNMINGNPGAGGQTSAPPGDTLGRFKDDPSPPGAPPGSTIPAIAEWTFLSWDRCKGGEKPRTVRSGVGKDSLITFAEKYRDRGDGIDLFEFIYRPGDH